MPKISDLQNQANQPWKLSGNNPGGIIQEHPFPSSHYKFQFCPDSHPKGAHMESRPLGLTETCLPACPPSSPQTAELSACLSNELHSCAAVDISPIMVALGKVTGKDLHRH